MRFRCVRCQTERIDTTLSSFFLCDPCAMSLIDRAFNRNQPAFRDFRTRSFCALCNEERELALWQWFLCPNCERLVSSYRRGRVAQEFVFREWDRLVAQQVPRIVIEATDPVELMAYQRPRGRRGLAKTLDFRALEGGQPVFWVEAKTGQRSIEEFATFQLDGSDCDDILNVVRLTNLPAYVFHVQLASEHHPPADRVSPQAIWWSDFYVMTEGFQKMERRRRNGGKMAAHFSPRCFAPLESLGPALRKGHHRRLLERLHKEGPPEMYRI